MLEQVPIKPKTLDRYVNSIGEEKIEQIRSIAATLNGARILHINATSFGGGVAELLATVVPLQRGLGLVADWQVMFGSDDFFNVTKTMHNALQGMDVVWTKHMEEIYVERNRANVRDLNNDYDFIVVHDPQPAAMLPLLLDEGRDRKGKWIWRCHIDTSSPFEDVAEFAFPLISEYDAAVFTMTDFVPNGYQMPPVQLIPPCIDPMSLKNVPLTHETVQAIFESYDMDLAKPLMCQVSRFDPWKDPVGVIEAYRMVKEEVPEVQLLLAGSLATDDPEGMHYLHVTELHAEEDPDIFILTNAQQVGAIEVNAFQVGADVILQKSLREGFGLTVSEALWKGTPVVGGDVGGIRLQVIDGENGYLVSSVEDAAQACLEMLTNPAKADELGENGRRHVRENYVVTTLLDSWLRLFANLAET